MPYQSLLLAWRLYRLGRAITVLSDKPSWASGDEVAPKESNNAVHPPAIPAFTPPPNRTSNIAALLFIAVVAMLTLAMVFGTISCFMSHQDVSAPPQPNEPTPESTRLEDSLKKYGLNAGASEHSQKVNPVHSEHLAADVPQRAGKVSPAELRELQVLMDKFEYVYERNSHRHGETHLQRPPATRTTNR